MGFSTNPKRAGFHITFPNKYTVSVQFGPGSYTENRDMPFEALGKKAIMSKDAECAVLGPNDDFAPPVGWDADVKGHMTPEEVLDLLVHTARR